MAEEKVEEASFEASLKSLEEAVDQLEVGNLPLSDALRLFEQGLKASNICRSRLEEAKQKVEVLVKDNNGDFRLEELDEQETEETDKGKNDDSGGELPF
ncbi:MAG: exodeoxyribonuclease VII small subunit [Candidatus Latescibacterota bacterium]|nr:exodeoxyribonuclease VII small subunit [Candidatus Latescibacterota bacterium]